MSKYVISFEDNPWYQDDCVSYYKCGEIPWWSAKKSDIKKLTPFDTAIEEAYQRGLKDGKKPEHECKDCRYYGNDYVECPCNYCSHNWESEFEPKANEIKVGDIITDGKINYLVIDITDKSYIALKGTDFEPSYIGKDYIKSYHNLHDSKDMRKIAEEITKAVKGEQQERFCIFCEHCNSPDTMICGQCRNYDKWEPKGVTE